MFKDAVKIIQNNHPIKMILTPVFIKLRTSLFFGTTQVVKSGKCSNQTII